ncbi:hypothetical protein Tco_0513300 [Tanacetum coccineum]
MANTRRMQTQESRESDTGKHWMMIWLTEKALVQYSTSADEQQLMVNGNDTEQMIADNRPIYEQKRPMAEEQ